MWLINSSIGKKFIMALTGICLVLFVTFHVLMNSVAILWPGAYNQICLLLGANWYALLASAGLGLLVVIHIIDALVLTIQNRKARGNDRYQVTSRPKSVEWSSQNMLVLGIVVLAFLGVHLVQFWARMQAQELMGTWYNHDGAEIPAAAGTLFLQIAFQSWWTPVVYIIGFIALWFHMNHGFWSMWQSIGWNNTTWLPRLKSIGCWWVSIVIGLFVIQAVVFTVRARDNYYVTNGELVAQYEEMIGERLMEVNEPLMAEFNELRNSYSKTNDIPDMMTRIKEQAAIQARAQELQQQMEQNRSAILDNFNKLLTMGQPKAPEAAPAAAETEPQAEPAAEATDTITD